ncbi:hypothetical protein [Sphingomonas flavalba]|uniref:F0F1 ATP synthase subunit B family protein n=1 Tax=Sphingomonas flavalba TaxID=2559804 RepID=UPI00109D9302|nr:hypothetical protein [Sphingomonas flavalba]
MPQFDFATFVPQLAWLTAFFAILYFGIVRFTLPKLGRVMTAREDQVTGDIATAERAKAEADNIQAAYDEGIAEARERARATLADSKAQVGRSVEARLAAAGEEVDARLKTAEAALEQARAKAMTSIESIAAEASADIVERFTGKRPTPSVAAKAAKAAVAAH